MAVDHFNLAATSGLLRSDPDAATQPVQAGKIPNVLTPAATNPVVHREVLDWMPTRWDMVIASQVAATGIYPLDGGTTPSQAGMGSNQIKLHASATPTKGMLVHILDGTGAKGEWAIVDSVSGANECTMHRDWTAAPDSGGGQTTRLLVPCWVASRALLKTEFENDPASLTAVFLFYDLGIEMDGTTKRAAIAAADGPHVIRTTGDGSTPASTADVVESVAGYVHGRTLAIPAIGGTGWKLHVTTAPQASGAFSAWGAWA